MRCSGMAPVEKQCNGEIRDLEDDAEAESVEKESKLGVSRKVTEIKFAKTYPS